MENAIDALKIAFAVFVFVIALALAVSVVGQARATSDIILSLNDRTNYYDYVEETDNNAGGTGDKIKKDRIVDFETILPTIYRYAKEQYAVTILNTDGTPIVRYDLYTEGFMSGWDDTLKRQQKLQNKPIPENDPEYEEIQKRIKIVDDYIRSELNKGETYKPIWDSLNTTDYNTNYLYKGHKVEKQGNSIKKSDTIHYVSPWTGDPNIDAIHRIQADLGYERITTEGIEPSKYSYYRYSDGSYEKNEIVYKGTNLSELKNGKFKEKFIEIQTSGKTITELDPDDNTEYSLETVKGNKKLEIIYILQKEE